MATNQARSSLVNFFIYNTDYGQREGSEEEKMMLFIPQEENLGKKINAIGICQALTQFALTFNPQKPCECLITQKSKQFFLNAEGNFWMVMTISIPYIEKVVKDNKVRDYYSDDIQEPICEAILKQSYDMFVLFNGMFRYIVEKYSLEALKERLEFFYTRYLQTLNFGQFDLLDVYQGVLYLPLEKSDFLRVQCFSNLIENTFPPIRHVCFLHTEQLLWTTLKRKDMQIMYKYLTSSLIPSATLENEDKSATNLVSTGTGINLPNPGRFLTGPAEMVTSNSSLPKRAPRVFLTVEEKVTELHLLVYKANNSILCIMVDLHTLTTEFCVKFHNFVGPQLGSLSSIITEQGNKRSGSSADQQYRFIYFNSTNLAIKSSIHSKRSNHSTSVSPEIMRLLVDIHKDLELVENNGEFLTKNFQDCWIVGKRCGSREFFLILNQKNATIVAINDEVQRLMSSSFSNILFLD